MANVKKKASAPMPYNDAIRVDNLPAKNSEALVTSGGVYEAIDEAMIGIKKIDFSKWDNGQFHTVLDNNKKIVYFVTFDEEDRPVLIEDNSGHETEIVWENTGGG